MTHETHNVAWEQAIAARTALDAFRCQQAEACLDWSYFDTGVGFLDQTIEKLRRHVRNLQPTMLATGGFPAAMAYLIEEIQAAVGTDMDFCQHTIDADMPPRWKRSVVRITQESLANACRHSKNKRLFLELTLDGGVLRIHVRDWGVGFKPDKTASGRFGLEKTCQRLELLGGTAIIESESGKGTYVTVEIPLTNRHSRFRTGPRMRFGEG